MNGKAATKRKIIPVEIWMTENFTVAPRIVFARKQPKRLFHPATYLCQLQTVTHRRFTIP